MSAFKITCFEPSEGFKPSEGIQTTFEFSKTICLFHIANKTRKLSSN